MQRNLVQNSMYSIDEFISEIKFT